MKEQNDFQAGAKAMFDYFMSVAAATDDYQKSEILSEYAEDALDSVSPDSCNEWRSIKDSYDSGYRAGVSYEAHKEKASGWISVKDELPREGQIVDIWSGGERVIDILFEDGCFLDVSYHTLDKFRWEDNVSHWMPTPEPPKE